MIKDKIFRLINEFRETNAKITKQNEELIWANIYKDSIGDKNWLKNLSISPGRWAANYSLLYILVRILNDAKPKKILELGLGETSKIISSFMDNYLLQSRHHIIEHNEEWIAAFKDRFTLSERTKVECFPLEKRFKGKFEYNAYQGLEESIKENFDFYLIDGPFGSLRSSRNQICSIIEKHQIGDEFIIVIDDLNRIGESDTFGDIIDILNNKSIKFLKGYYEGVKSQGLIVTEKYHYLTSL